MQKIFKADIRGKTLTIETGKAAKQASGSVFVQYGETVVLVSAVSSYDEREVDFLPLTVEYQERIYASGRIPGNYFRREIGRPSAKETLTSRLIDRPIRPLFPKGYSCETQIIATVLSMDKENDADTISMIGASAALEISDIPFEGPVACVRVARIEGEMVINPSIQEAENADINIIVAGSKTGIVMVEGGADTVSEEEMLEAVYYGHQAMQPIIDLQIELKKECGKNKRVFTVHQKDEDLANKIEQTYFDKIKEALLISGKSERNEALRNIKKSITEEIGEEYAEQKEDISEIIEDIKKKILRYLIIKESRRIDGRKFDEIRPITCEVGILPRTHGSSLFTRGETQVLGVLTLGTDSDEQRVETLSGDETRSFMLHYNFPPFSVGEVKRIGGPSRRDIGHGALAARSIEKIIPSKKEFDYSIRIVSEVLESNGSSSMGTVCAAAMSLMDGGVPIKAPVAGIAMGLVKENDNVVVLSDIMGDEDHCGDMDFKVAGTRDGITVLQMDIKIRELSKQIMQQALKQAHDGRIHILDKMLEAIDQSRERISMYAPTVVTVKINPKKIRDIIGPGGKVIRELQTQSNTKIDISEEGLVKIAGTSAEECEAARKMVKEIAAEPEIGGIYEGKVMKITDFGAFVEILPGTDGLVHISQLAQHRVQKVRDEVIEGETIRVKVLDIAHDGKIRLSRKALLPK